MKDHLSTDADGPDEQDPVAALRDGQADAGDEGVDREIYDLDVLEARERGVDLDVVPDEPPLD